MKQLIPLVGMLLSNDPQTGTIDVRNITLTKYEKPEKIESIRIPKIETLASTTNTNKNQSKSSLLVNHQVKKGDTLAILAKRYNTDIKSIKFINSLKQNKLKLYYELKIPENFKIKINSVKSVKSTKSKKGKKKVSTKKLVKDAKKWLGTKYRYGGSTRKGIDCSAFVKNVYKKNGKNLPRTSRQQAKIGKAVSKKNLRVGDLVFFAKYKQISHVGIYLGNDKFVHASSGAKKVTISRLSKAYYRKHYVKARRI